MKAPTSDDLEAARLTGGPVEVESIEDRDELRAFLSPDPIGNAYLLGDLRDDYFPFCAWYGVRRQGDLEAVLVHYDGLSLPAVRAVGDRPALDTVFLQGTGVLPQRFHFHLMNRDIGLLEHQYDVSALQSMQRMGLRREEYSSLGHDSRVRRLGHGDTAAIMALYEHYPDNLFEPSQLETGLYFGVDGSDDELLSIAGVHVVSREFDIAAIGNLVTHPDARGQGLASAATGRLLDELFERVSRVALNVREDNRSAVALYDKFGFSLETLFWEGRGAVPDDD
mgnify:CR=1 FL=1